MYEQFDLSYPEKEPEEERTPRFEDYRKLAIAAQRKGDSSTYAKMLKSMLDSASSVTELRALQTMLPYQEDNAMSRMTSAKIAEFENKDTQPPRAA